MTYAKLLQNYFYFFFIEIGENCGKNIVSAWIKTNINDLIFIQDS